MSNQPLKLGLIGGFILAVLSFVIYFIDYPWLVSFTLLAVVLIFVIALMTSGAKGVRAQNGGAITFGQAFGAAMTVALIITIISTVVNLILHQVIDTELADKLHNVSVEKTVGMMEKFDVPSSQIDDQIDVMDENKNDFSISSQMLGIVWVMIFYCIPGLIIGAVVKKEEGEV